MPVNFLMNHDSTTGGTRLDPDVFIRLIKGRTIRDCDYNDDGGRVNWFKVELNDGTWFFIHNIEGVTCVYTVPPRR